MKQQSAPTNRYQDLLPRLGSTTGVPAEFRHRRRGEINHWRGFPKPFRIAR